MVGADRIGSLSHAAISAPSLRGVTLHFCIDARIEVEEALEVSFA